MKFGAIGFFGDLFLVWVLNNENEFYEDNPLTCKRNWKKGLFRKIQHDVTHHDFTGI